jgi:PAS domain S-box-containing protein
MAPLDGKEKLPGTPEALLECCRRLEAELRMERSHLGSLFEAIPDLACIASTDGYFKRLSASWERVLGYSRNELLSIPYGELIHPDDLEPTLREVERQLAGGNTAHFVNRYRTKEGGYRWLEWNASPAEEGTLFAVARDITVRREQEQQLRLWADAFRYCAHGLAVGDPAANTITACNPAFAALHGMEPDEVANRGVLEFYPDEVRPYVRSCVEQLQEMPVVSFETERQRKDGSRFPVQMDVVCVHDAARVPLYTIATVQDITERKRSQEERSQLEAQLQQAQKLESIGRLAGGVAHDLNNLLMPILGYAEMLERELAGNAGQQEEARAIQRASMSARRLIWQLLAFSRTQTLELGSVDLNGMLRELGDLLHRSVGSGVAVEFELDPSLPPVHANAGQLEQVVVNLALNARDAMPSGGLLRVRTSFEKLSEANEELPAGGYAVLEVADTGCGIRPEDLPRIFEPFFTTKGPGKGTGLGLSTVYGIVRQHRGHIVASSPAGDGCCFRVLLPLFEEEAAKPEVAEAGSSTVLRRKVLVVEDNDLVRKLMVQALNLKGYEVADAPSGEEAIGMVTSGVLLPDLVISDVIMPVMNGRELCEQLKLLLPEVKVIYISGYTSDVIELHGLPESGLELLHKPFTMYGLIETVERVLRRV